MYEQALNKLLQLASSEKKKRYVAVLWTAWKEHENAVNAAKGIGQYLHDIHLYGLYNRIHSSTAYFEVEEFFIDPVAELFSEDGKPKTPKKNFKSHNLDIDPDSCTIAENIKTPGEWLAEIILEIEKQKTTEEERANSPQKLTNYGLIIWDSDPKEAYNSFEKAIELDDKYAHAYDCLGVCLWNGHGVTQEKKTAFQKFRQAAKMGYPNALRNLQILERKFLSDVINWELNELREGINEAKRQILKVDAEKTSVKINADARVKEAEQKVSKAETQLANNNFWCRVLTIALLLSLAVAGYFAYKLYDKPKEVIQNTQPSRAMSAIQDINLSNTITTHSNYGTHLVRNI